MIIQIEWILITILLLTETKSTPLPLDEQPTSSSSIIILGHGRRNSKKISKNPKPLSNTIIILGNNDWRSSIISGKLSPVICRKIVSTNQEQNGRNKDQQTSHNDDDDYPTTESPTEKLFKQFKSIDLQPNLMLPINHDFDQSRLKEPDPMNHHLSDTDFLFNDDRLLFDEDPIEQKYNGLLGSPDLLSFEPDYDDQDAMQMPFVDDDAKDESVDYERQRQRLTGKRIVTGKRKTPRHNENQYSINQKNGARNQHTNHNRNRFSKYRNAKSTTRHTNRHQNHQNGDKRVKPSVIYDENNSPLIFFENVKKNVD